jgi:hypothetical protein
MFLTSPYIDQAIALKTLQSRILPLPVLSHCLHHPEGLP